MDFSLPVFLEHLGPPDASPNFRSLPVANTAQTSHLHVPIVRRAALVPLRHAAASPPARAARAQDMMPTTTATAAPRPPPSPPPPPSAATAKAPGPGATAALLLPSSPADTRAANTSITETLHILDAFNHRHHNQHRATHWWSSFRILRRRLQSLRDALLSSARAAPAGGRQTTSSLSRWQAVRLRAGWMRTHVVPRAYMFVLPLSCPPLPMRSVYDPRSLMRQCLDPVQFVLPAGCGQPTCSPRAAPPRRSRPRRHRLSHPRAIR